MNILIISTIIYTLIIIYIIYEFKKENIGELRLGIEVLLASIIYIIILLIFYLNFTVKNIIRFLSIIIVLIPIIITTILESYLLTCNIKSL